MLAQSDLICETYFFLELYHSSHMELSRVMWLVNDNWSICITYWGYYPYPQQTPSVKYGCKTEHGLLK